MAHEISIYYGALCPDSQRLIVTQIQPAIQRLPRYILDQIRLVPSGKSETFLRGGIYTFRCQLGPLECLANKYHACLYRYISDPVLRILAANCIFQSLDLNQVTEYDLRFAVQSCCSLFQLDFYTIDACATGREGDWLLAGYVKEAEALFPTIDRSPTITFQRGVNDPQLSWRAERDFVGTVCMVRRLNTYHCFVRTRGSGESRSEKESEDEEKSKSPAETLNYGKDSKN